MLKSYRLLYVEVNLYTIHILLKTKLIQIKTDCYACSNLFLFESILTANAQIITCVRTSSAYSTGVFPCSIHADTHLQN